MATRRARGGRHGLRQDDRARETPARRLGDRKKGRTLASTLWVSSDAELAIALPAFLAPSPAEVKKPAVFDLMSSKPVMVLKETVEMCVEKTIKKKNGKKKPVELAGSRANVPTQRVEGRGGEISLEGPRLAAPRLPAVRGPRPPPCAPPTAGRSRLLSSARSDATARNAGARPHDRAAAQRFPPDLCRWLPTSAACALRERSLTPEPKQEWLDTPNSRGQLSQVPECAASQRHVDARRGARVTRAAPRAPRNGGSIQSSPLRFFEHGSWLANGAILCGTPTQGGSECATASRRVPFAKLAASCEANGRPSLCGGAAP